MSSDIEAHKAATQDITRVDGSRVWQPAALGSSPKEENVPTLASVVHDAPRGTTTPEQPLAIVAVVQRPITTRSCAKSWGAARHQKYAISLWLP
ncbi:hypothetical protein GGTG_10168 [Gaeumannomyces tritici R3-111a-1]|uniref:Uncharacterized protein n=1 Tax=Gaeumannomyces tritici (strain R3-111a-1) TaxID=644352 RepID=J3P9I8_GAET3|nr:hypothetical protein GGTG_10168 [Gaeumannomyces tritici R3-111a-1]EJT73324.1 hypothetical protein GGTG_10168 [Gaeumannomyces tritici R3-111a-1]